MRYKQLTNAKIFINIYLNGKENHILSNSRWKSFKKKLIRDPERKFILIIEIQNGHWISVQIIDTFLYYLDPCIRDIPYDIIKFARNNGFSLKRVLWVRCLEIANTRSCWKYSLYFTISLINKNVSPQIILRDKKYFNIFAKELNSCKLQLQKVKGKVKISSMLLSEIIEKISQKDNYKQALCLIHFAESFAMEDRSLDNDKLKHYFFDTIGQEDAELIKTIRYWLLHRKECYIISPQDIFQYTLQGHDIRTTFVELHQYVEFTLDKLFSKEVKNQKKQLVSVLFHKEDISSKVNNENPIYLLEEVSYRLAKQEISLRTFENPERILFDFLTNFIPIVQQLYKKKRIKEIEPLKKLDNLRNHLIHNIHILYGKSREVPYIMIQNTLNDAKDFLLKLNFSCKFLRELENISETEGVEQYDVRINNCLKKFREQWEELRTEPVNESLEDPYKFLDKFIDKIELYFQSLFILDRQNKITINKITVKKFDLPEEFLKISRFTDDIRRAIFQIISETREIHQSSDLPEDYRKVKMMIMEDDLKFLGVSDLECERICESILNPKPVNNEELVKEILKHVTNIIKLKKLSKFKFPIIISDYFLYVENNKNFNLKKYQKILKLEKFSDKGFEIDTIYQSFYVNLSDILKNFLPLYFNLSPIYTIYKSPKNLFQDYEVVQLISCNVANIEKVKFLIDNLPYLVPLGVELLCLNKLNLKKDKKREFMKYLMKTLLTFERGNDFIRDLFSDELKTKDFNFAKDCLGLILDMNLLNTNPNKLNVLFDIPVIKNELISILNSKSLLKFEYILLRFIYHWYNTLFELYELGKFKEAFDRMNERPNHLLTVLQVAEEKNIGIGRFRRVEIKFLIAKIEFHMGQYPQTKSSSKRKSHLKSSLDILNALLKSVSQLYCENHLRIRWELPIKLLRARIYHLLRKCKKSCKEYKEIFLELFIDNGHVTNKDNEGLYEQFFDEHGFIKDVNMNLKHKIKSLLTSRRYKSAIKLDKEDLSILKIMTNYGNELVCLKRFQNINEKRSYCEKLVKYFIFLKRIQKQILGWNNYITKKSHYTLKSLEEQLEKYQYEN